MSLPNLVRFAGAILFGSGLAACFAAANLRQTAAGVIVGLVGVAFLYAPESIARALRRF